MEFDIQVMALIVALGAFAINAWNAQEARNHDKISVTPHILINFRTLHASEIIIEMESQGLGPAEFIEYKWLIDNEEFHIKDLSDYSKVIKKLDIPDVELSTWAPIKGEFFNVGYKHNLIHLNTDDNEAIYTSIKEKISIAVVEIKYKSIYGEIFTVNLQLDPQKLTT